MDDILLIKKLDEDELKDENPIPVTFNTNISDKEKLISIFDILKGKRLVGNKRLGIKKSSITLDVVSSNITEVIKEFIRNECKIYGVYILYDNYLGGKFNEWKSIRND